MEIQNAFFLGVSSLAAKRKPTPHISVDPVHATVAYDSGHETFPRLGPSCKSQEEWPLCERGGKSIL